MELIPAVDIRRGLCVRLRQGKLSEEIIYSRDPVAMARRWEREGAMRLHVVDLDAAILGRHLNKKLIINIARSISIPVQVGGGIRSLRDIEYYLCRGIDRVILGTKLLEDNRFLLKIKREYIKKILVALDVKNGKVALRGWTEISSVSAITMARKLRNIGVAGIVYTDINRDGMLKGPNIEFMLNLIREVDIPVIVSGGIADIEDIRRIKRLSRGKVRGVIIGQALYSGRVKLRDAIAI